MQITYQDYHESHKSKLVDILKQNTPKYFSVNDIGDFCEYLDEKNWIRNYTFIDGVDVIGCGGHYINRKQELCLSWMFLKPGSIGSGHIIPYLKEYLGSVGRLYAFKTVFRLNTTPIIAKLLLRVGFSIDSIVHDGYGVGYDKVEMSCLWTD